jgi:glycosyltransferase involved in cell wall biosynthesis
MTGSRLEDPRQASYSVYRFLKRNTFDVVYFNDCGGQGYYSILAKRTGQWARAPRMVMVTHGPQDWVLELNAIAWDRMTVAIGFLERRSGELADQVISPSQYMVDWLSAHGWRLPSGTRVLPNIVRPGGGRMPESGGIEPGELEEIVFFGRIEMRKGVGLFCDAIDRLEGWQNMVL